MDLHFAIALRRWRRMARAERRERGGTKRLRGADKVKTKRCNPGHDRKPCIARSRSLGNVRILCPISQPLMLPPLDPWDYAGIEASFRAVSWRWGLAVRVCGRVVRACGLVVQACGRGRVSSASAFWRQALREFSCWAPRRGPQVC